MKKILLVCDTDHFPEGAFKMLQSLHLREPFLLTGLFLHAVNDDLFLPETITLLQVPQAYTDEDIVSVKTSISRFTKRCIHSGMEYRVHEGADEYTVDDVVRDSRFADLLVLSEELFFSEIDHHQPNQYMRQILHKSECPILVVPESHEGIKRVAIAYDGSKESMYAIKMFGYLLPAFTLLPAEVLYWVEKTDDEVPELQRFEEYAARHFTKLDITNMFFDKERYIGSWSAARRDTLVVTGAYSRSFISRLFKKSFVDEMIKHPGAPIFIAHSLH